MTDIDQTITAWVAHADVQHRSDDELAKEFNRQHAATETRARPEDFKAWKAKPAKSAKSAKP